MTKKDLISKIAEKTNMPKKQTGEFVTATLETITESLQKGEKISLIGFGSFFTKERKERNGVNPRTKEKIVIPATTVPKFSAGKRLKEAVK